MTSSAPARILIADNPEGQHVLTEALHGYDLITVGTVQQALRMLAEDGIDLIICGIHFDDSRMIELFRELRKDPRHKDTLVVAFRASHAEHEDLLRNSVTALTKTLHVSAYLEWDTYLASRNPHGKLRKAIEISLPAEKIATPKNRVR